MMHKQKLSRRDLLKSSAVAAGTLALSGAVVPLAQAQGSDTIRVGVVGCGGRGSGAAANCVESSPGVKIVALADAFPDRMKTLKNKFNIPDNRCFVGIDAYKELMALEDINVVILATPPGFRPQTLAEAVKRGKNVFMEKPVAVCPAGMVAAISPEAVSITTTVLFGAAHVTISFDPSGLSTNPVGLAGTSTRRAIVPPGSSTQATCLASALRT